MALSALSEPTGQQAQAASAAPGPGASPVRQRFDAVPQAIKDLILDKYRNWNVEHDNWWDGVYDCFKSEMEEIGIEVDKMYFSGFWSQGDGACFEGCVRDWSLLLPSLGYNDAPLINLAASYWTFGVTHSGHYYHENCTRFSPDLPLPEHDEDSDFAANYLDHEPDSLHEAVALVLLNKYSASSMEREITEAFKDHMRELYRQLEQEYDYLTSDEAVLDSLEANEQLKDAINEAIMEHDNA